jgi:hypothetical protein
MAKPHKIDDAELLSLLQSKESDAMQGASTDLSTSREEAMRRYLRLPQGDEQQGRSQVISSDVFDTVEWMLASIIDAFVASNKICEFEPVQAADVEHAKQATDTINHVFWKQNPGFLIVYQWVKDALMYRNGHVGWRYVTKQTVEEKRLKGLTEEQVAMLQYDPTTGEKIADVDVKVTKRNKVILQPGPLDPVDVVAQEVELVDVTVRQTMREGQCQVINIPPEALIFDRDYGSIDLSNCPYVCHLERVSISDIRMMGIDIDDDEDIEDDDPFSGMTDRAMRMRDERPSAFASLILGIGDTNEDNETERYGWLRTEFIKVDRDGDGVAELLRVRRLAGKILDVEYASHIPFATFTPIIMQHRILGLSIDDITADIQLEKTIIKREMADSLAFANINRHAVLTTRDGVVQANIDDLLNPIPGGLVREYQAGAVRPLVAPFNAAQSFPFLQYIDDERQNRTGFTKYSQGMDSNSLNKTATGTRIITGRGDMRIKLMARIMAELGFKKLMLGIMKCLKDSGQDKKIAFRLNDKFIETDPREWADNFNVSVLVGLGTGDKDQQLMHLGAISQAQKEAVAAGGLDKIVTLKNIYNTQVKIAENSGYVDGGSKFWTDPEGEAAMLKQQQDAGKPKPPSPDQIKAQSDMQLAQMKLAVEKEIAQMRLQNEQVIAQMKSQFESQKFEQEMQLKREVATNEFHLQSSNDQRQAELDERKAALDANSKVMIERARSQANVVMPELGEQSPTDSLAPMLQAIADNQAALQTAIDAMIQVKAAPLEVVRDNQGRLAAIKPVL